MCRTVNTSNHSLFWGLAYCIMLWPRVHFFSFVVWAPSNMELALFSPEWDVSLYIGIRLTQFRWKRWKPKGITHNAVSTNERDTIKDNVWIIFDSIIILKKHYCTKHLLSNYQGKNIPIDVDYCHLYTSDVNYLIIIFLAFDIMPFFSK